ncbi:DUF3887 domain-containing protein [Herbiconiux moechotypicola]|nr:DUF3887 domain-containing protein [Herbiconiux moechotypicola]MCS5731331.1 DUF3887 domain-containing protein [Herbiconiux moechotypicola]
MDPALDIRRAAADLKASENRLRESVTAARAAGASWREIGDALGTSRQAAFTRFGDETGRSGDQLALRTTQLFESLSAGDYESVRTMMSYSCARALTKRKLLGAWADAVRASGAFVGCANAVPQQPDGRTPIERWAHRQLVTHVFQTALHFARDDLTGRVAYDSAGRVIGILMLADDAPDRLF